MAQTTKKPVKKASKQPDIEAAVLAKSAEMPAPFAAMGKRLHALIRRAAPALQPTLYYGMPWYAKDGTRICFFRADKLMTFGLTEEANLAREDGASHQLLPSAWYLRALDAATEPGSPPSCAPQRADRGGHNAPPLPPPDYAREGPATAPTRACARP